MLERLAILGRSGAFAFVGTGQAAAARRRVVRGFDLPARPSSHARGLASWKKSWPVGDSNTAYAAARPFRLRLRAAHNKRFFGSRRGCRAAISDRLNISVAGGSSIIG